jgi:hypothetical protein
MCFQHADVMSVGNRERDGRLHEENHPIRPGGKDDVGASARPSQATRAGHESMIFQCFRCEHPGYCQLPESVLVRCARCNLVQPMDLATPYLANTPDAARSHPLPRRWRAIPGRRIVRKAILLGCVIGAGSIAALTMEVLRAHPRFELRLPGVTASPRSPTSADPADLMNEDKRLGRRLRERRDLAGRAEHSRRAESHLTLRAPAEPKSVLPSTGPGRPPLALTAREAPHSTTRTSAVEPRSISTPPALRLDQRKAAGDGWWAEPDLNPWRPGS